MGVILHALARFISIDPAAGPAVPGRARSSDSGRARSKPFAHAPVFRMTFVGKSQLPQTTTTTTTTTSTTTSTTTTTTTAATTTFH